MNDPTPNTTIRMPWKERANNLLRKFADRVNRTFNALPQTVKRITTVSFGVTTAWICGLIFYNACQGTSPALSLDKMALPKDIYMDKTNDQALIPIGKMKGEIDGEFEAFHLAADSKGQIYINRDIDYGEDAFDKANGWEPITRQQLEQYEKNLHFLPPQKRSLKP